MKKGWTGWIALLAAVATPSVGTAADPQPAKALIRETRAVQEFRTDPEQAGSRQTDSERVVSGRVLDENRKPIAGALIAIPGRWDGAVTDRKGRYRIVIPKSVDSLEFRFVSYRPQVRAIRGRKCRVILQLDTTSFDRIILQCGSGR